MVAYGAVSADLRGKAALVTGAGRGLGRAVSIGLAKAGADVALMGRTASTLREVAGLVEAEGVRALVTPGSVARPEDVERVMAEVTRGFGGLDILINNAGISPWIKRTEELTDEDWHSVLDVNLHGVFYCLRAAYGLLVRRRGCVINIGSVHGSVGIERILAYAASKGAIEMITRCLALEWADVGIRVNTLAPGYFETDLSQGLLSNQRWRDRLLRRIPARRFGAPDELMPAVEYLATAHYVTGTTVYVDGGWTAG